MKRRWLTPCLAVCAEIRQIAVKLLQLAVNDIGVLNVALLKNRKKESGKLDSRVDSLERTIAHKQFCFCGVGVSVKGSW